MTFGFILISLLGVFEALLGLIVYVHDQKNRVNRIFLFFVFSIILWTVGNYLADLYTSIVWTRITYVGAIFLFYTLFLFAESFPTRSYLLPKNLLYALHAVTVICVVLVFIPNAIVTAIVPYEGGINVVTGSFFFLLGLYYVSLLCGSFFLLVHKFRKSVGIERLQLQYISFGLLVSFAIGLLANFVIPIIAGTYVSSQYGPYGVVFFLVLTTFAIIRYNLLNITVIATEVFSILLILILLFQLFLASSATQIIGSFTILVLSSVLSFFLIRSTLREVRQKEQLAKLSSRLEEANTQLKHLDETKSEFVSIASHQLRTPLTVIKGYLSMMMEGSFGKIPKTQTGPLEKVYESANRLIELVENLLSVSRIESGRMKYNMAPTQLSDMAASVVEEIMPAAQKKKLKLEYHAPIIPPPVLSLDAEKLRQVMMNLVDNAVKYTKKGTVDVTVRVDKGSTASKLSVPSVVFEVKDTGGGVRKDDQERLFQKFIRGQGSSLVHTEGTGLGLYVGRMMVEAHNGRIWVESAGEGMGATFAFAIPIPAGTTMGASAAASTPATVAPNQAVR